MKPEIHYKPDGAPSGPGTPGIPEILQSPEDRTTPEALLGRTQELYTVEGDRKITRYKEALMSGNIGRIQNETERAIAYMEGLYWGIEAKRYGFEDHKEDDRAVNDLKNTFESAEDSKDRPSFGQLYLAVRNGIINTVEEAEVYKEGNKHDSVEWRKSYGKSFKEQRLMHWEATSQRNREAGKPVLTDKEIANKAQEDLDKYEKTVEWRKSYGSKFAEQRLMHWRAVSHRDKEEGRPGLSDEEIEDKVKNDLDKYEGTVKKWRDSINDLKGFKNHFDARVNIFDRVFVEVQETCEDENAWMDSARRMTKPDKGHWKALYQSNRVKGEKVKGKERSRWGEALNNTENAIEAVRWGEIKLKDDKGSVVADGYDIYSNGFRTTGEFVAWAKAILPFTKLTEDGEERMDILFFAWKKSLLTGNISRLAWIARETKDEKEKNIVDEHGNNIYMYDFGNPPFASDLMTKVIHNEKVRAKEFGWCANNARGEIVDLDEWALRKPDGNVIRKMTENDFEDYVRYAEKHRTKKYKAVSHSGHPLSIGRIGKLVDDYESHTTLEKWENPTTKAIYEDKNLKNIGKRLSLRYIAQGLGVSRADTDFPWANTEIRKPGDPAGEVASGSFGGWHLSKIRAHLMRFNHIRKIPLPNELTLEFFNTPHMRMWERLKILNPGSLKNGVPQNEFAWWLAGVFQARRIEDRKKPTKYTTGDRGYRSKDMQNKTVMSGLDEELSPGVMSEYAILQNALTSGAISQAESGWMIENIVENLG